MSTKMTSENASSIESATEVDLKQATELFDYIRFTGSDMHGIARGKSVAKRNFKEFFTGGLPLFAGTLAFSPTGQLNFIPDSVIDVNLTNSMLKPVPGTLHALPWATEGKYRVGEVFCEWFWPASYRNGTPMDACPRSAARRQLDRLAQLGYRLYSGFEGEFIVCDSDGEPIFKGTEIFVNDVLAEYESYLYSMDEKLESVGVDVTTFQMEYTDGQFEMVLAPKYGIESPDQMFLFKHAVKEMTKQHNNWRATFMTSPTENTNSGLHFSHSLWSLPSSEAGNSQTSHNVFYDPSTPDGLSNIARHWIAGLLHHGPAMTALCAPTVNCYRRFRTLFTPTRFDWGFGYRSASIRAKVENPVATYLENRLPAGAANPYIVVAATVAAGIDGVVRKLECPPPTTMSHRLSAKDNSSSDTEVLISKSLSESLKALENDTVLCEALGTEFIKWFVRSKRSNEIPTVEKAVESGQNSIVAEKEIYFKYL